MKSIFLCQPLLQPGALLLCSVAIAVTADGHILAAGRETVRAMSIHFFSCLAALHAPTMYALRRLGHSFLNAKSTFRHG
jgi:hypothetical protein